MALTDKLTAIADAIRAKGGTTDLLTLDGMVEAINAISAGGGLSVASGAFTVATDYSYTGSAVSTYSGDLDIDTGLSNIDAILVYSKEWLEKTAERPCFGSFIYLKSNVRYSNDNPNVAAHMIGIAMNATTGTWFGQSVACGALLNFFNTSIPAGHFSIKTHSSTYPIKAGHTIKWIAVDGFTAFDEV